METSNSSLGSPRWKYHVFISFRGEDTRFKFTDHLYAAFRRVGINAFRDKEGLRTSDEIAPALLSAIEESKISIIVFSRNYASSTWCLDELVKILECKKEKQQVVLPIFYEVDPSEIRHQIGSFGDAMVGHEEKYKDNIEKVQKWRSALHKAANMCGESYKKDYESKFIDKIIQKISSIVSDPLLHVPELAVGLKFRISQVISLLSIGSNDVDVHMVGIYGTGGIGKTTIAKAIYNSVSTRFESTSFCADVRENTTKHGLAHIQQTILREMLGDKHIKLNNIHQGVQAMRGRLQNKKVFLVLDDVEKLSQLQSLAGGFNWFGAGSRVIVTTRDKQLLNRHGIEKIYEVKELDDDEALELLCQNAFRCNQPKRGFENVATRLLSYARGVPLALEIIGSHLFGKGTEEWECAMDKYKKSMDEEIFGLLRVSYDNLEHNEKEIFLDVACFFRGIKSDEVEQILEGCGFSSKSGLRVLEDRCLVKRVNGDLWMHDLTQSMGREIVRRESEREPGKRSRLWFHEDVLQVLNRDTEGTSEVEGIMLELPQRKKVLWSGKAFKKMANLRILIIRKAVFSRAPKELPNSLRVLEWQDYPSSSMPSNFYGNQLMLLRLKNAPRPAQLQEPFKKFQNITILDFSGCKWLTEVPDVSAISNLTELCLDNCRRLIKIHDSVGKLDKLSSLYATDCIKLKEFPGFISLEFLDISGCPILRLPYISKPLVAFNLDAVGIDFQCGYGSQSFEALIELHYSRNYVLSGSRLPGCFCRRRNKNFISFWIQKKLPVVRVGFGVRYSGCDETVSVTISYSIGLFEKERVQTELLPNMTYVIYLPSEFSDEELRQIDEELGSGTWVRVDVRIDCPLKGTCGNQTSDASVTESGVRGSRECDRNLSFVNPHSQYSIKNKSFPGGSVKNGGPHTTTLENNHGVQSSHLLWKKIMSMNVPLQVKHFTWTAISDCLPSKWTPERKGKSKERDRCDRCKVNMETAIHVLKKCQWARVMWLISPLGLRADRMKARDFGQWVQELVDILDTESLELFLVIAWGLWSERDRLCLGLKTEDPPALIRRMCLLLEDYRITHRSVSQYVQTYEEMASHRPSSHPLSADGDKKWQKKKGKHGKSMDKGKQPMR